MFEQVGFVERLRLMTAVLLPNSTHAYFQSKGEESDFLRVGYKVNWNRDENTFALYDDFNPGRIDNDQILFPKSKFFVSVDLISIAFPLPIVFYYYTTTENALADLLYANLKMKKLIEEYEDIQERSKKLIWDSQFLFQQRDNTGSIYQVTRRLRESSIQTTGERSILVSNQASSFRPSFGRNNRLRPNFKSTATKTQATNIRDVENPIVDDQDEEKLEEKEPVVSKEKTNKSHKPAKDFLVFDLFIKLSNIIPYFKANIVEGILFGAGLGFVLLLLISISKR